MKLILCPLTFPLLVRISLQFVLRHSQSMLGEDYDEYQPSSQLMKSSEIMIYIYVRTYTVILSLNIFRYNQHTLYLM
jgi:hypothetical protein